MLCVFFFSSRRRHTRWPRDWSSDVCSSDLDRMPAFLPGEKLGEGLRPGKLDPDERADLHAGLGEVSEQIAGTLEIGRASCRERVESSVGAVALEKEKTRSEKRDRSKWKKHT